MAVRCPTPSARSSIRSSASAARVDSPPAPPSTRSSRRSSPSRASEVLDLVDKYREPATFERAATLAWTQAQVQLHHLGIEPDEAHLFQRLANRILYSDPSLRPARGRCWPGTSAAPRAVGPTASPAICRSSLVRIDEAEDLDIVRQLLRAHEYWRLKLLDVDLVIINEHGASYAQDLQDALETLVRTSQSRAGPRGPRGPGGVHILRGDLLSAEDRTLLQTAARAVLLSRRGTPGRAGHPPGAAGRTRARRCRRAARRPAAAGAATDAAGSPRPELEFFNGLGGFADGGREYVIVLGPGQATPAPWLNVVANPSFGFQVSESGSGYTWAENSRENQLTPWSNDPVSDPVGEAIYVRDDESGEVWGPTALPIRGEESTYVARHGPGYSRFEHERDGIGLELVQFVPLDEPVKVSLLTIENRSGRRRRLSVTAYAEWVLGDVPRRSRAAHRHRARARDRSAPGAQPVEHRVRRPRRLPRPGRTADGLDRRPDRVPRPQRRTGPPGRPRARTRLQGAVGAGLDPCAALQTSVELAAGATTEVVVLLGQARRGRGRGRPDPARPGARSRAALRA